MVRETKRAGDVIYDWRHVHKCKVFNLAGSKFQEAGIPDCVIITDGLHIWVEFKKDDKEPDPKQARTHYEMEKQGTHVYVVNFFNEEGQTKEWRVDDIYVIKFKLLKDGYKVLLDLLINLESERIKRYFENKERQKEKSLIQRLVPVMSLPIIP